MTKSSGFTLMEILITVAIVAILAAIAFPNYSQYVQRTRRADAQEKLLDLAAQMERWFFAQNQYPTGANIAQLGGNLSKDGHYSVTINSVAPFTTYTLTATPVDGSSQKGDTECSTFSIDNTGARTAKKITDSSGSILTTDATATCWKR
jgi:type IV pilus assembly protein PilE